YASLQLEARYRAILAKNLLDAPTVVKNNSFPFGFLHLAFPGRHLLARFQAHHAHFLGAGTDGCAGRVELIANFSFLLESLPVLAVAVLAFPAVPGGCSLHQ